MDTPTPRTPFDETSPEQLYDVFVYHPPSEEDIEKFSLLRERAYQFAREIVTQAPRCADRTFALRLVRMALHTANAAVALKGKV